MTSLLLNMVFGSAFMLILKWVQVRGREDVLTVGAINYIVAMLLIAPELFLMKGADPLTAERSTLGWAALGWGAALGLCYFTAFFFVIRAIRIVGASRTAVVGALSMLMPIAVGVAWWGDRPEAGQAVGIGLAVIALVLIAHRGRDVPVGRPWLVPLLLLGFFALAGLGRLAQDAFKHTSHPEFRPLFLWVAFAVASVPSLAVLFSRRRRPCRGEWLLGSALGAANILQTHFMLHSLQQLAGYVVFPASSAGGLLLTTLVATLLLGERLSRRALWGIGLAAVALILLNWSRGS